MILFGLCLCASFVSLDFVSASFVTSQRANINILAQTFIEEDKKEGSFFFFHFRSENMIKVTFSLDIMGC